MSYLLARNSRWHVHKDEIMKSSDMRLQCVFAMCRESRKLLIYKNLNVTCKSMCKQWDLKSNKRKSVLCGGNINFKYVQHPIPKFTLQWSLMWNKMANPPEIMLL